MLLSAVVTLTLCAVEVGASSVVAHLTDGTLINASNIISKFSFAEINIPSTVHSPLSFALSDPDGHFGRLAWDEAQIGVQGGVIARKLLSLGGDAHHSLVRSWLLGARVLPSGLAFCTHSSLWHAGSSGQGCFDANAELILIARDVVAHARPLPLDVAPFRLTCLVTSSGAVIAATVPQPGGSPLDTRWSQACNMSPTKIISSNVDVFRQYFTAPFGQQHTFTGAGNNPGNAVGQVFQARHPFQAILLAAIPHNDASVWPFQVAIYNASDSDAGPLSTTAVSNLSDGWLRINLTQTMEPGTYIVEMQPLSSNDSDQSYWLSAGWLTDPFPFANTTTPHSGMATNRMFDVTNESRTGQIVPVSISATLLAAMEWQLQQARTPSGDIGVLVIRDPVFNGAPTSLPVHQAGSNGYLDVIDFGFKDGYINLRFLQSLSAYQELLNAHLVPALSVDIQDAIATVSAAILATFATDVDVDQALFYGWIGCASSNCPSGPPSQDDGQVSVNYSSVFVHAMAAAAIPTPAVAAGFAAHRTASRRLPGIFSTNVNGFIANTSFAPGSPPSVDSWRPSAGWKLRADSGYADYSANNTGDWHIFEQLPGKAPAGYGGFSCQEENGGTLLSSTAFVFQAGVYLDIVSDFQALVAIMDDIAKQLEAGDVSQPLVSAHREYLRVPVTDPTIRALCQAVRPKPPLTDAWGQQDCDYYKSITFDLPEGGAFPYAFAEGVLQLRVQNAEVSVYGTILRLNGSAVTVELPEAVRKLWPAELKALDVGGLRVGGHTVDLTCTADVPATRLTCGSGFNYG